MSCSQEVPRRCSFVLIPTFVLAFGGALVDVVFAAFAAAFVVALIGVFAASTGVLEVFAAAGRLRWGRDGAAEGVEVSCVSPTCSPVGARRGARARLGVETPAVYPSLVEAEEAEAIG